MRKIMIQMMKVGDPMTFEQHGLPVTGWLKFIPGPNRETLDVALDDNTVLLVSKELVRFRREATSPVGPQPSIRGGPFDCQPCGHGWDEHDDTGCLWMVCACWLPGERK